MRAGPSSHTTISGAEVNGELESLVATLQTYKQCRKEIELQLVVLREPPTDLNSPDIRRKLRGYLSDWQGLLRGHVHQAQQVLRRLVKGRLTLTPTSDGYRFDGVGRCNRRLPASYVIWRPRRELPADAGRICAES